MRRKFTESKAIRISNHLNNIKGWKYVMNYRANILPKYLERNIPNKRNIYKEENEFMQSNYYNKRNE